jgi:hypothetical protein
METASALDAMRVSMVRSGRTNDVNRSTRVCDPAFPKVDHANIGDVPA